MIDGLDRLGKEIRQQESRQSHQSLEGAKPSAAGEFCPESGFFRSHALTYRHREGVHAHGQRQKQ